MNKKLRNILIGCFLFIGFLIISPATEAKAYGLSQTGATTNSVTVSWEPIENATKYDVYVGSSFSDAKLYKTLTPDITSINISGLKAGSEEYVKVEYYYKSSYSNTIYSGVVGSMFDAVTLPGKVTGVKQERWWYYIKQFDAAWDKQSGVTGYQIQVKDSSGKKKSVTNPVGNTNCTTVSKISNSKIYTMQVRAYTDLNGKRYYGEWSNKAYFFTQPRVKSIYIKNGKMTVKWSKVSGATGYSIYVSTKQNSGYKKVKSVSSKKTSAIISKFKNKKFSANKKYWVYVVTKKKVGKTTYTSGKLYTWSSKGGSFNYSN